MDKQGISPGVGVKVVAMLLMLGGIYGAIWGLYEEWQVLTRIGLAPAAWTGLFVVLFGWCTWVGFEVWHGERWAFKIAKVIFAAQIPNFTLPGFSFDGFFTGLRVYFMVSGQPPNLRWGFNLASGIHFAISPQLDFWLFGINLIAVVALVHLVRATADKAPTSDKFGLI
ncbi:MAG TPA: hypothetical protein VFR84_00010 [Candidatus Angelobacter sp.]|nr:hypothetical protein [Candidatus Angelobacter sp.]